MCSALAASGVPALVMARGMYLFQVEGGGIFCQGKKDTISNNEDAITYELIKLTLS